MISMTLRTVRTVERTERHRQALLWMCLLFYDASPTPETSSSAPETATTNTPLQKVLKSTREGRIQVPYGP